ncbi:MAG TPA: hypothetical protein VF655_13575 [Allosphingosinicella sp.]|jgi:hypothetical protein
MNTSIMGSASAACLLLLASTTAVAQTAPAQTEPMMVAKIEAATGSTLKQGTEIRLETVTELSSNRSRVGDRIDLEVKDAVRLGGQTVIPAGTRAVGEITRRKDNGMWGKAGKLEFKPLYIKMGDRQIGLSATNSTADKGKAGTAGVVAAVVFLPVAGFFVKGTSAKIPARTAVTAYVDEDVPVAFAPAAAAAPAPIVVPATPNQ